MPNLKSRVERLESELNDLKTAMQIAQSKDSRRAVEKYAGDDDLQAVFAEAQKLRKADRKRVAAKPSRRRGQA